MATKKAGVKSPVKKQPTKKELQEREKKFLADAEARLIAKHNTKDFEKVVPGSIRRGTGDHEGKLTVKINTRGEDGMPDGKTRVVATSDVHQVDHTEVVAERLRRQRRNERARAKRAETASA